MGSALGFSCATAAQEEKLFLIRIWVYTGWAATECRQHGFMQPDVIPISEWVSLQHCYYSSHNFFSFCSMAHNLSRVQPCFTVMSCGMVQGTMLCTHVYGSHVVGRVPPFRQATSHVVGYMPFCQATCPFAKPQQCATTRGFKTSRVTTGRATTGRATAASSQ